MRKRKTVLIFLLLAYSTMLGHAVIPHHHHDSHICIAHSEDSEKQKKTEHESDDCENEQESKCTLLQDVVLPSNHTKKMRDYAEFDKRNFPDNELSKALPVFVSQKFISLYIGIRLNKDTIKPTSVLIHYAIQLRAPPRT
jgi:hypothetical protein